MRYHYIKPKLYLAIYGDTYVCDHPVYNTCTLFKINEKRSSSNTTAIQSNYKIYILVNN